MRECTPAPLGLWWWQHQPGSAETDQRAVQVGSQDSGGTRAPQAACHVQAGDPGEQGSKAQRGQEETVSQLRLSDSHHHLVPCYTDEAPPWGAPAWLQMQMLVSPGTPSQTNPVNIRPNVCAPAASPSGRAPLTITCCALSMAPCKHCVWEAGPGPAPPLSAGQWTEG